MLHGTRVNVHDALETDMTAQAIHLAAEVFDPDTEYAFRYLQVGACQMQVRLSGFPYTRVSVCPDMPIPVLTTKGGFAASGVNG